MHMRLFYVPVNNFSLMSERFPVFLGKTSILSNGLMSERFPVFLGKTSILSNG